jgi:segregation and condensation protein A
MEPEILESCSVKLQSFEGPLDLLLHLIKKHEIDIYDIPIALISEQYNQYLEMMKELNLDIVGDYLRMAAELGYIKSRMLLPKEVIEEDDELEDPREELVRRLIEYQRYKDASYQLFSLDLLGRDIYARKFDELGSMDLTEFQEPLRVDLWTLIDAFKKVIERQSTLHEAGETNIIIETYFMTVEDKMEEILQRIEEYNSFTFFDLFELSLSKMNLILTFLALLELVKEQIVIVYQEDQFADIKINYAGDKKIANR